MIHDIEWAKIDQRFLVENIKLYRLTKNISTPSESVLLGTINSTDENKIFERNLYDNNRTFVKLRKAAFNPLKVTKRIVSRSHRVISCECL